MNCVCGIADVDFDAGNPMKLQNLSGFLHTCLWYPVSLTIEAVSDEPISIPPDYSSKDRLLDRDHMVL